MTKTPSEPKERPCAECGELYWPSFGDRGRCEDCWYEAERDAEDSGEPFNA